MKKIITNEYYVACLVALFVIAWGAVVNFVIEYLYFHFAFGFLDIPIFFGLMFLGLYVSGIFLKTRYVLNESNNLISTTSSLYLGTFLALLFTFLHFETFEPGFSEGEGLFLALVLVFLVTFLYFSLKLLLDGKFEIAGEKEKEKEVRKQSRVVYWSVVGVIPWLLFITLLVMIGRVI